MITLLVTLTAITPGQEIAVGQTLGTLPSPSPLAALDGLHFARWVVIGQAQGRFPTLARAHRTLRMKYLLFTAGFDGAVEPFLEDVRRTLPSEAQAIWGLCVGFPGVTDRDAFHGYFAHNRLAVPHKFLAYQHPVPKIKKALDVRDRHIAVATDVTGVDDAALLARFLEEFG